MFGCMGSSVHEGPQPRMLKGRGVLESTCSSSALLIISTKHQSPTGSRTMRQHPLLAGGGGGQGWLSLICTKVS